MSDTSGTWAKAWATLGLGLGLAWTSYLAGVGLFDSGTVDPRWSSRIPWLLIALIPSILAVRGFRHGEFYGWAALASLLFTGLIFVGALSLLPLIVPGAFYLIAFLVDDV